MVTTQTRTVFAIDDIQKPVETILNAPMPPNLRRKAFSRERCGTDEIAGFQESLWTVARRKLDQIDSATDLQDLKIPPNNRLETLKGDRAGQYSIRINRQYRICFQWADQCATDVEIVDYH